MKRIHKVLLALTALLTAVVVFAANHTAQSFAKGPQINIPANDTKYYGDTGVQWTNNLGGAIKAGTNSAGITYGAAWQDINNYALLDGSAGNGALLLQSYGAAATSTNNVVYTFTRSVDGSTYSTNVLDDGHFAVTVLGRGVALQTTVTNLPSWFTSGAKTIRLYSISTTGSGAGAIVVTKLAYGGFVP